MERPQPNRLEVVRHLFEMRFDGEVTHTETGERFNVRSPRFEEVFIPELSDVYEHYKSTPEEKKHYYVDGLKYDTETEECYVIYAPMYELDNFAAYARPFSMFLGSVDVDGEEVARFRRV